ncbi:hypothetical protein HYDPIDRAFT_109340, partial [Hydnomerulius pinastri MD-312]
MEAELATIINDVYILQVARMCQLAAATVVVYDHVLSFPREVNLIWKRPMSVVTQLYFVNRYVGDAIIIISAILFISTSFSTQPCRILFQFQSWGPFVSVWSTQAIMQLRIFAMYRKSWKVLIVTAIFFAMEIAAISYVLATHFDQSLTYTNQPLPGLHMCSTSSIGRSFTAIYVPIFCFELFMFVLAAYVVYKHMVKMRRVAGSTRLHATMNMIAKYSTVYFFVEMSGCAIATGMYLGLPALYLEITNSFLVATTIILGSRLVINTRDFYSCPAEEDSWPDNHMFSHPSSIQYTHPSVGGRIMEMSVLSSKDYSTEAQY